MLISQFDLQDDEQTEENEDDAPSQGGRKDEKSVLFYRYVPGLDNPGKSLPSFPRPPCLVSEDAAPYRQLRR